MKAVRTLITVAVTVVIGMGLAGCGPAYTGEGVVVDKQIEKTRKTVGKRTSTRTHTDYELTLDVPGSTTNQIIDVSQAEYDTTDIGETVRVENGKLK